MFKAVRGSKRSGLQWLRSGRRVRRAACVLAATAILASAGRDEPALAQTGSSLTTEQLIELLVQSHVLSRTQVNAMIQKAQTGAAAAPAGRAAGARTPGRPGRAAPEAAAEPVIAPGTVRVTYIPESTRQEIAAEVKQQVMQEAQDNGWAAPNVLPGWVQHVRISGDIRVRGEGDLFDRTNFNAFPNFNAIDGSSNGFDSNNTTNALPPILNTTRDRVRVRLRARLDVAAQVADWIDADIRIASGNDNSPVSTNQTLGTPGDFSKYSLWLDRAYVKLRPIEGLGLFAGRSPNPFWTSDLLFDDDVNFDGIAAQYGRRFNNNGAGLFLNVGAFPVFNTDFNFGTTNLDKGKSRDAYLFAVQGGGDYNFNDTTAGKLGIGYFAFSNVQGSQSSPCFNPVNIGSCDTDNAKPGFVQFGNTLSPLRNVVQDPSTPNGPIPQLYGLASRFDILDIRGQIVLTNFNPIAIVLDADYLRNLGYNRDKIIRRGPVNNLGSGAAAPYDGGNTGYAFSVSVGHQQLDRLWDWNGSIAYKYLESDAVLDALTDSDFHLGGTNAKGTILTGNLGLAHNAYLSGKWFSTNQVSGPAYAVDVVQLDLNVKF